MQLQRSRAPESAEMPPMAALQNIAVMLQRSRAPESAEIPNIITQHPRPDAASTEPCSGERGDASDGRVAEYRRHASTEPRSGERGDKGRGRGNGADLSLQRSRAPESAEICA